VPPAIASITTLSRPMAPSTSSLAGSTVHCAGPVTEKAIDTLARRRAPFSTRTAAADASWSS
jgi:hypothetical protein